MARQLVAEFEFRTDNPLLRACISFENTKGKQLVTEFEIRNHNPWLSACILLENNEGKAASSRI